MAATTHPLQHLSWLFNRKAPNFVMIQCQTEFRRLDAGLKYNLIK